MEKKIDFVKILRLGKKGIGPIIFLCLTMILALLGFLYSLFYCTEVKIHKTPSWYIGDDSYLGYAFFWGGIIFSLGFLFVLVHFIGPEPVDISPAFFTIALPLTLSGLSTMFYQARYIDYKMVMNALLNEITFSLIQEKTTLENNIRKNIIRPSTSFNLTEMLEDLKDNGVIDFQVNGETIHIEILSSTLREYCIDENDPSLYEEWECKSCGANYRTKRFHTENFQCEYCGAEKSPCGEIEPK